MSCHPKLLDGIDTDERHKPMLGCIKCHAPNPEKMAQCGNDCFACHSMVKIYEADVDEHDVIQGCRDCHVGAVEKMFDATKSFNQSTSESLKDFLVK
jgi:hypothetical protein